MAISEKFAKRLQLADHLLDSLILIILFGIGICRYRSVLVLALILFLRFVVTEDNIKIASAMLAPFLIFALIVDIKLGQYHPVFPQLSPIISILVYLSIEYLVIESLKSLTYSVSGTKVFTVCPRCFYNNGYPLQICGMCKYNYDEQSGDVSNLKEPSGSSCEEMIHQRRCGLPISISNRRKLSLNLNTSEHVEAAIKISPFRGVYKNGSKLIISYMIITDLRITFIRYGGISGGWKVRYDLPIKDIDSVKIENKVHHGRQVGFIILKMFDENLYEMFYAAGNNVVLNEIYECIHYQKSLQINCQ